MASLRRLLLRFVSVFRAGRAESDLAREIAAHLRLLEDRFVAQGMTPEDARFAAKRAFGGVEQVKERQRDERSFPWLDNFWLDWKLGARMLVKYPGLTLVAGPSLAVAIAIAAGAFTVVSVLIDPDVPLPDAGRLVAIQSRNLGTGRVERRVVHDFVSWRDHLTSLEDVGAYRQVSRNAIAPGAVPEAVRVVEMSAAGFRAARVTPLMGRHLNEDDERPGAPPVVVIGSEVWRARFAADPGIIGRSLQLGPTVHAIVGVMPDGFAFPVQDAIWVPLGLDPSRYERRTGPAISVFGRLSPDATLESAQAELTVAGQRTPDETVNTGDTLQSRVVPYTYQFSDLDDPENVLALRIVQLVVTFLLVVVCVNVAILVYARTAMRQGEIAVRTALGASRRRIVAQLFIEALVLSTAAAAVGVVAAGVGLEQLETGVQRLIGRLPFWMDFSLSFGTVIYVSGLAILAAAIAGALPALKATGWRVHGGLQPLSAGGGSGMLLGRTWTLLIVAQVAFAVALLPAAVFHAWTALKYGMASPGFAAEEFLTATLILDRPEPASGDERAFALQYTNRELELTRKLKEEAGVEGVTFSAKIPGEEPTVWVEAEGVAMPSAASAEASGFAVRSGTFGHEVRFNRVDVGFFETFDVPILMGRGFDSRDVEAATDTGPAGRGVIVNRTFVDRIFGGANALGRRVRYAGISGDARDDRVEFGRWYEVVGVVSDFPANPTESGLVSAKLYHAATAGDVYPAHIALRLRGTSPASFANRLREISAAVDPALQLRSVMSLDQALRQEQSMMRILAASLAGLTASVVLLSAAGIYALMSFTVSRRRKEIGIRAALGADSRRILHSIFSRALVQLGIGAVLGMSAAILLDKATHGDLMRGHTAAILPAVALFMVIVGLLAALGPARRGLRIQPTDALREP